MVTELKTERGIKIYGRGIKSCNGKPTFSYLGIIKYDEQVGRYLFNKSFFVNGQGRETLTEVSNILRREDEKLKKTNKEVS